MAIENRNENQEKQSLLSHHNRDENSESSSDYGIIPRIDEVMLAPKDNYNIVYILFFIQGIGMLLPWNIFIAANEYFRYKFAFDEEAKRMFENAFSVGAQVPGTLALIMNLYMTGRVPRHVRVIASLVVTTICFIITAVFVNIDTKTWTHQFYIITLACVVTINTCSGIYQGTIYGIAGATGARYIQGSMTGIGLGGIFASLASLISLAIGKDIKHSAVGYFSTAASVTFICIIGYILLFRLKLMKYYFQEGNGSESSSQISSKSNNSIKTVWFIFKQIYPHALSVCFIFCVTISLMPAIISNIESVNKSNNSPWTNKYFSVLICFLLFSGGDFAGRVAAGSVKLIKGTGPLLPIFCFLRIAFIPLFILCNYQPRQYLPVVFKSDAIPVILNFFFATSNGYLGSLCMMYAPEQVPAEHMESAGVMMQLFLTVGLSIGAGLSYVVAALI